jgi:hypothetical protein
MFRTQYLLRLPIGCGQVLRDGAITFAFALAVYAASGWTPPVSLSVPIAPTYYATSPAVAVASTGAQAAAWINEDNYLLLQVAAQDAGGAWTPAQTLTPASGVNAADPTVAVSPKGNAVAMWDVYTSGGLLLVQASARAANGSWGAVKTLTSGGVSSTLPKVGMDANGNAVAIWLQTTSTGSAIEASYLPASGSWTTPAAISAAGSAAAQPVLAVNSAGDAIAGWQTSSNGQIVVAERHAGVWTAPVIIAAAAFRQNSPHVALNDRGDAAVVWTGRGTALAAIRPAGGGWSATTTLSTQSSGASARVAIDSSGNTIAIFQLVQYTGSSYSYPVQAVAHPAGGTWGALVTISGTNDYGSSPNLVVTPLGTFVAAWEDDNTISIRAAIRPAGQSAFGRFAVIGSGSQAFLAAAAGHTAATWIGPGPTAQVSDNLTP